VAGAELRSVSVVLEEGRYGLTSEALFGASQEDLYAVLTDYELFEKFTSAIVESRNLEPGADGRPRFYTRMEGCILFYCKNFVRNGYLLLTPKHDIVAIADPDESDFEYSRERWRLSSEGEGTLLIYEFEMEPSFWVPPVVGPYLIKRVLQKGAGRALNRIEALARGEEPPR
jgi:hypothetical protein